jgi:phosphoglycerate-specific signal transduction histidine kinase
MNKHSSEIASLLARCEALQREQQELARFALIGQAFIGLAHELNNALNSMMLQTSVVQMRVDEQGRQELAAIRQQGAQAAGLLRTLQHVVQERREKSYFVDLNSILMEILEEETKRRRRIALFLTQKTPQIQSTRSAVKQLVRLLLEGACAATETTVKAETDEQDGAAILSLTIPGLEGETSAEALLWQNLDEVSRLAGQSLLRQLNGSLTMERSCDAVILYVIWKQAA